MVGTATHQGTENEKKRICAVNYRVNRDTCFLLENLRCCDKVQKELLSPRNFNFNFTNVQRIAEINKKSNKELKNFVY